MINLPSVSMEDKKTGITLTDKSDFNLFNIILNGPVSDLITLIFFCQL